ncbi:MAG: hypothetical protein KAJ75_09785 [Alphaproteobacteria bacterium]|nr:hypothetical protein [Alphaproteobacteria bacterium]
MVLLNSRVLTIITAVALCGCSFASDALFPSLSGDETAESIPITSVANESFSVDTADATPVMGSTNFKPLTVTPGNRTGTFVGKKVVTFRTELWQLQETIRRRNTELQSIRNKSAEDTRKYHEIGAFINARLQLGTTPGNPKMRSKWRGAQRQIQLMSNNVAMMNQLATQVASDSAMTAYLLDSIRAAYNISGAVDEDHHQLRILEDETNQTAVLIERLLNELNHDISRQQQYLNNEDNNLKTLAMAIKNGQLYGASISNAIESATQEIGGNSFSSPLPSASVEGRRPLVVIRFDRANVPYEQALYQAIKRALERHPETSFDLIAVTPSGGLKKSASDSRRNAEMVLRSLTNMGLPTSRIRLSAMTNASSHSNEVHLYIR